MRVERVKCPSNGRPVGARLIYATSLFDVAAAAALIDAARYHAKVRVAPLITLTVAAASMASTAPRSIDNRCRCWRHFSLDYYQFSN